MKKMPSPGQVVILSNYPRTRGRPDSRGPRLCFQELGRSCALQQGFLIFTDGSAYAYDAPSNEDVEALCDQLQRGRTFNFFTRRSGAGFVRGFTPPADYETIYSFPPYEGTRPPACGVPPPPWFTFAWSQVFQNPSNATVTPSPMGSSATAAQVLFHVPSALTPPADCYIHGIATYNGPSVSAAMDAIVSTLDNTYNWEIDAFFLVSGSVVASIGHSSTGPASYSVPIGVSDTMGSTVTIEAFLYSKLFDSGTVGDWTFQINFH